MSKKNTGPPPRPPAPKLGGSGGGISFSFKALEEEDDDEELTASTGKYDKQVSEEKERNIRNVERSLSKSPDTKTRPAPFKNQNSLEKLIDMKDKLHVKIKQKVEELSSDNQSTSTGDLKALDTSSTENVETAKIANPSSLSDTIEIISFPDNNSTGSVEGDTEYFEISSDSAATFQDADRIEGEDNDETELEINEDYYNPDGEDFSELPGVVPTLRQRKRFQKYRKIKPIVPQAPISMSKLTQSIAAEPDIVPLTTSEADKNINANKTNEDKIIVIKGAKIPVKKLMYCVIVFFLYLVIPLPSYISGMFIGVIMSSGGWMLYLWVMELPKQREPIPEDPTLDKLPPLPVPEMKEPKGDDCSYKCWMNEIMEYTPDNYSINQTHSVYVHLEGTTLRLRRPKINVPKRAMWDEASPTPQFVHQRHFDIEGSRVLLLPPELVKKRLWSKKYPICIALARVGKKQSVKADGQAASTRNGKMSTSSSVDSDRGFEIINEQKCEASILYLFTRTCHEKEQWFKRLDAAARGVPLKNHVLEIHRILNTSTRHRRSSSSDSFKHKRQDSSDSVSSLSAGTTTGSNSPTFENVPSPETDLRNFVYFMSRLMPRDKDSSLPASPAHMANLKEKQESRNVEQKAGLGATIPRGITCDPALIPINAILGRCFYDFLRDKYWADKMKDKLQKKLSKIHIPYFIEQLKISDIDLGMEVPVIRRANKPFLDETGFWIDLDLTYSGKFKMTIETKVNLLKLKTTKTRPEHTDDEQRSAITNSDEEDSAESSTDEEEETGTLNEDGSAQAGGTGKKIMKYINKITASNYFQRATELKYIKKAMTEVSNTPLVLTVEVQKLNGTMAINIPPPPSDRLWYGFRGNPQLWLVAKPKVGEREVTMTHITDWIEKKLALEFQHVLVMPNMDDMIIPILLPGSATDAVTCLTRSPSTSEV